MDLEANNFGFTPAITQQPQSNVPLDFELNNDAAQSPIIAQQPHQNPQSNKMTSVPLSTRNCPPGLEYLTQIDQLLVHQKVELLEAFTGFETNNKYIIKNSLGQKVYWAVEDTDCCTRCCCGQARPFDMRIFDFHKNEVMQVSSPPGNVIGTVIQEFSFFEPRFIIKNPEGEVIMKIEGPCCTCGVDVEYKVLNSNGINEIGCITKQWSGLGKELFTDADNFCINFSMHLDVKAKALIMGALFLIDFMFYEKSDNTALSCLSSLA